MRYTRYTWYSRFLFLLVRQRRHTYIQHTTFFFFSATPAYSRVPGTVFFALFRQRQTQARNYREEGVVDCTSSICSPYTKYISNPTAYHMRDTKQAATGKRPSQQPTGDCYPFRKEGRKLMKNYTLFCFVPSYVSSKSQHAHEIPNTYQFTYETNILPLLAAARAGSSSRLRPKLLPCTTTTHGDALLYALLYDVAPCLSFAAASKALRQHTGLTKRQPPKRWGYERASPIFSAAWWYKRVQTSKPEPKQRHEH